MTLLYKFSIYYKTPRTKEIIRFMNCLDVWTNDVEFCLKDEISFDYTKEEKPIEYFEDLIKRAFETIDADYEVVKIEGGKIVK